MNTLTLEARLNIAMDTLAKPAQTDPTIEYQNNTKHTVTITYPTPQINIVGVQNMTQDHNKLLQQCNHTH